MLEHGQLVRHPRETLVIYKVRECINMIETGVAQIENFRPLHVQVLSIRTLFGNIALGVCEEILF